MDKTKVKYKKIAFAVISILAIFVLCFYSIPIRKEIDTTVIGIQFRIGDQPSDYIEREITLKGTYKRYLFGNKQSTYQGFFSIEGYDYTFGIEIVCELISNWPNISEAGSIGFLQYWDMNSHHNVNFLGSVLCTKNFNEFIISIYEPVGDHSQGWNRDSGLIICAPAINREDAGKIIELLVKESAFL